MKLSIHHFFDILRDNPRIRISIVSGPDDVCRGCVHLLNNRCDDTIGHRQDFTAKEAFNAYLDQRIMEKCDIRSGDQLSPLQLCQQAQAYLDHIFWIYEGNDEAHTQVRKNNVIKGLAYYLERHGGRCISRDLVN